MQHLIKVILAEDHEIVRLGLRPLLDSQNNISVVAEAANGQEVLDLINGGQEADLVLADLNMPLLDGIGLTGKLKSIPNAPKIIILTMLNNEKYVIEAFDVGAQGYLLKNLGEDELFLAIRTVHAGSRYICCELSLKLLDGFLQKTKPDRERIDIGFTGRELEVLDLISQGYTNTQMGEKLSLSRRTIEGHRETLLFKTRTKNTATLIRFACLNNYIS